jgi:hypothetical protein
VSAVAADRRQAGNVGEHRGEAEHAELERRNAQIEQMAAELERDRARLVRRRSDVHR